MLNQSIINLTTVCVFDKYDESIVREKHQYSGSTIFGQLCYTDVKHRH